MKSTDTEKLLKHIAKEIMTECMMYEICDNSMSIDLLIPSKDPDKVYEDVVFIEITNSDILICDGSFFKEELYPLGDKQSISKIIKDVRKYFRTQIENTIKEESKRINVLKRFAKLLG